MNITQEDLKELMDYDPKTGELIWKVRDESRRGAKSFNNTFAGRAAGNIDRSGNNRTNPLRRIHFMNHVVLAHHLVWLYHHGRFPKRLIHRNNINLDNRIENLVELL